MLGRSWPGFSLSITITVPGSTSLPVTGKGSATSEPPRIVSEATEQLLLIQTVPS